MKYRVSVLYLGRQGSTDSWLLIQGHLRLDSHRHNWKASGLPSPPLSLPLYSWAAPPVCRSQAQSVCYLAIPEILPGCIGFWSTSHSWLPHPMRQGPSCALILLHRIHCLKAEGRCNKGHAILAKTSDTLTVRAVQAGRMLPRRAAAAPTT